MDKPLINRFWIGKFLASGFTPSGNSGTSAPFFNISSARFLFSRGYICCNPPASTEMFFNPNSNTVSRATVSIHFASPLTIIMSGTYCEISFTSRRVCCFPYAVQPMEPTKARHGLSASCNSPCQYKTLGGVDICCSRKGYPDESGQKSRTPGDSSMIRFSMSKTMRLCTF